MSTASAPAEQDDSRQNKKPCPYVSFKKIKEHAGLSSAKTHDAAGYPVSTVL